MTQPEPTKADQRVAALLQSSMHWAPDPAAPNFYLPESAAPSIRLRPDETPEGPRYTLLLDGIAVREFDELPAGWVIDHGRDLVAEALDRLRDGASEVRRRAIWQLQALGDRRALPALEWMALTDQGQVTVERGFVDDYEPIYPDAIEALHALYGRLGLTPEDIERLVALLYNPAEHPNGSHRVLALGGEALRPALRTALASPELRVIIRAARTLAELREPGTSLAQLAHPNPEVRHAAVDLAEPAVWGASWVGWPPAEWRDAILARLAVEPEPAVRARLVEFITQYCQADAEAMLAVLRRCLSESDRAVRSGAARRLRWFKWSGFGPALPALAEAALAWARAEPESDIRISLLWNAPLLPHAPAATAWLIEQLDSGNQAARRAAATRLADAERERAAEPLLRAADSPDRGLRWAALASLATMGETRALPKLDRELNDGPLKSDERQALEAAIHRLKPKGG